MEKIKVQIPEGKLGGFCVEHFTVSREESEMDALRGMMHGGRFVRPGTYTRLRRTTGLKDVVMSDTHDELSDLWDLQRHARNGKVLVMGLGLGCAVQIVLSRPEVEHVTVVEISPDVLHLVGTHLLKEYEGRLTLVLGDAFKYKPPKGERYSAVWHDIWDHICSDNLKQMTKLKRRFGRHADWQGCWSEHQCRRYARQRNGLY